MTAQRWFEEGGQQAELQRIGKIKNSEQQLQALAQFNERNTAFMAERTSPTQPPPLPQQREKAQTHPAIEEAINEAMRTETGWMRDLNSMSDEQLRERRLNRLMDQDRNRGRLESGIETLSEYKASRPNLVETVAKDDRTKLERKEILSRMVRERRFNITNAKVAYEEKLNPQLVQTARLNLTQDGLSPNSAKFNDELYREVGAVKRTLTSAKSAGFKI